MCKTLYIWIKVICLGWVKYYVRSKTKEIFMSSFWKKSLSSFEMTYRFLLQYLKNEYKMFKIKKKRSDGIFFLLIRKVNRWEYACWPNTKKGLLIRLHCSPSSGCLWICPCALKFKHSLQTVHLRVLASSCWGTGAIFTIKANSSLTTLDLNQRSSAATCPVGSVATDILRFGDADIASSLTVMRKSLPLPPITPRQSWDPHLHSWPWSVLNKEKL